MTQLDLFDNHAHDATITLSSKWGGSVFYLDKADLIQLAIYLARINPPPYCDIVDDSPEYHAVNIIDRILELANASKEA